MADVLRPKVACLLRAAAGEGSPPSSAPPAASVPWKAALVASEDRPEVWAAAAEALARDRVEALVVVDPGDPAGPSAEEVVARDALAEPAALRGDAAFILTRDFKFVFVVRRGRGPVLAGPERFLARVEAALGDLVRRVRLAP